MQRRCTLNFCFVYHEIIDIKFYNSSNGEKYVQIVYNGQPIIIQGNDNYLYSFEIINKDND